MRRLLSLALVLLCASAFAQPGQFGQGPTGQRGRGPTGGIVGHIICGDTNAPARMARVSLMRLPDPNSTNPGGFMGGGGGAGGASTDFEGGYFITGVTPGTYALRVQFDGYVDPVSTVNLSQLTSTDAQVQQQIRSSLQTVTISSTETVTLDARIERGGSIAGQILYDDGSPASGLNLLIRDAAPATTTQTGVQRAMLSRTQNVTFSRTDDRGNFRITSIPPGEYYVLTTVSIQHPPVQGANFTFRPGGSTETIYAPGTYHTKQAKTVKIKGTEEVAGIGITVPTRGMHSVSGTVVMQTTGAAVSGGGVTLTDADDTAFHLNSQIAPDGTFRVDFVPPGSYTLRANGAQLALSVTESDVSGVTVQVPLPSPGPGSSQPIP